MEDGSDASRSSKVCVSGSRISADSTISPSLPIPPTTRTLPSGRSVAVCHARGWCSPVDNGTISLVPGSLIAAVDCGPSGQILSLGMTSVTITNNDVSVINPDGTTLVAPGYVSTSGGSIDMPPLPASGTYAII